MFANLRLKLLISVVLLMQAVAYAGETYVFAVVPQFDARQLYDTWNPIITAINKTANAQITLVIPANIPDFEKALYEGQYDFVYMNPYHFAVANQKKGYIPLLKDTSKKLRGIIVVSKNGSIKRVEDLQNKTIALPAPNALGASMFVRADLKNKFHVNVTPKYVGNHDSVYLNVALGLIDAGGGIASTLKQQADDVKNALTVLYETTASSPHPIAVHPRIDKALADRVKRAFVALDENQAGHDMLAKIPIERLGDATTEEYRHLLEMGLDEK